MEVIRKYVVNKDPSLLLMNALAELREKDVQDVADALWTLDVELSNSEPAAEPSRISRLQEVIKGYVEASPLERFETVCSTVELETLAQCGLVDLESARKSLKKKNTFLKYRQTKFNLVREESEGFAKLISELLGAVPIEMTIKNSLPALIGYFRLDPNRVLDLILDSLHHSPERLCRICQVLFVDPASSVGKLEDLLSFKLSRLSKVTTSTARKASLTSIAQLLARGMCSVQSVVPHLKIEALVSECTKQDEEVLSTKSKPLTGEETVENPDAQLFVDLVATTLATESGWKCTLELLDSVPGLERHIFRDPVACQNLHTFFMKELQSVYTRTCTSEKTQFSAANQSRSLQRTQLGIENLDDFASNLCPLLERLGPESVSAAVTKSSTLLHKVVRLLGKLLDLALQRESMQLQVTVQQLLVQTVFPAITLLPSSNPVIVQELWDGVLVKLESTNRFALYERWREIIERKPMRPELAARTKMHLEQVNFALKRFCSDFERNLVPSRKFAKVAHVNPFCAFQNALRINDNLIPFMVQSLEFCTKLELDVLGFLFCDVLVQTQADKLKGDLTNDALWFSATCQLIGEAFRKCPDMDVSPLLELVFDRCVKKHDVMFLRVLEVLLASTTLMDIVTDYSKALLESSGGGDSLKLVSFCAFSIAPQRRAKFTFFSSGSRDTSLTRLRKLLEDEAHGPFFIKFLLAMAFQRKRMLFETKLAFPDEPNKSLKLKALLFDQVTAILLQLSHFVATEVQSTKIEKALPSLVELTRSFQLEKALAMHLHRMVLSPRKKPEPGRFNVEDFKQLLFDDTEVAPPMLQLSSRFWELALYDVNLPKSQYEAERAQLESMKRDLERESATTIQRKMINKVRDLVVTLKNELQQQTARVEHTRKLVDSEREAWRAALLVPNDEEDGGSTAMQRFFQHCLVPRLLLSHEDAFYCAKFVQVALLEQGKKQLGEFEQKFFSTVFTTVVAAVKTTTERETECLGVFTTEMLECLEQFIVANGAAANAGTLPDYPLILEWKTALADCLVFALSQDGGLAFLGLTLLSSLKEVFPDTDAHAKRLQPALAKFMQVANGGDEEELEGFEAVQRAVLRSKADSLLNAIKRRKDTRKLRNAQGEFPAAPPPEPPQIPAKQQQLVPASTVLGTASSQAQSVKTAQNMPSLLGKPAPVKPIQQLASAAGPVKPASQGQLVKPLMAPSQQQPSKLPLSVTAPAVSSAKSQPQSTPVTTKQASTPATGVPQKGPQQQPQPKSVAPAPAPSTQQQTLLKQSGSTQTQGQKQTRQPSPPSSTVSQQGQKQAPSGPSKQTQKMPALLPSQQQQQPEKVTSQDTAKRSQPPADKNRSDAKPPIAPPQQQQGKTQQPAGRSGAQSSGGEGQAKAEEKPQTRTARARGRGAEGEQQQPQQQQQSQQQRREDDRRKEVEGPRRVESRADSEERQRGSKRAATESATDLESRSRRGMGDGRQTPSQRSPPARRGDDGGSRARTVDDSRRGDDQRERRSGEESRRGDEQRRGGEEPRRGDDSRRVEDLRRGEELSRRGSDEGRRRDDSRRGEDNRRGEDSRRGGDESRGGDDTSKRQGGYDGGRRGETPADYGSSSQQPARNRSRGRQGNGGRGQQARNRSAKRTRDETNGEPESKRGRTGNRY